MSRIAALDVEQAGRSRPLLEGVARSLGMVPNMMSTMAQSPAVLEGYLALSGALGKGSLNAAVGEQIALLTAEENGCEYCAAAHTAFGKAAGLDETEIADARAGVAREARTTGALAFARAVIEERGHVTDAEVAAARAAGLSDGEIAEVVAHVALNVFTNYFNTVAETEVDFPAVRPPRRWRLTA